MDFEFRMVGSTLLLIGTPLTTICSVEPLPTVAGLAVDAADAGEFEPPRAGGGAAGAPEPGAVCAIPTPSEDALLSTATIASLSFVPK